MSLFDTVGFKSTGFHHYLNTGTLFDVLTGSFVPGAHGGMILNGGLARTNSFMARQNMFKSTILFSYVILAMGYYPRSICAAYDTEDAQKRDRLYGFSSFPSYNDFDDVFKITTRAETTAEEYFDQIKKIAEEKILHRDDYLVESPMLDPRTGKTQMILLPTFGVFDSWSQMQSSRVQEILDAEEMGTSKTKMIYMQDGIVKKMMASQIPTLAGRANIYFLSSAHIGGKFEANPNYPSPKSLPHMRQGDAPKDVGSAYTFLMQNNMEMRHVRILANKEDKHCQYPGPGTSDTDLHEVISVMTRGKGGAGSGPQLTQVVSQNHGVMPGLTDYHYCRETDYFGLIGGKSKHKVTLTDTFLSRNTARQELTNPKTLRAMQIIAQLCYIQKNWQLDGNAGVDFMMKPDVLAEKLLSQDSAITTDILQSRGYWTYDKKNDRPYLSVYDVLAIADGSYKAKGVVLGGFDKKNV